MSHFDYGNGRSTNISNEISDDELRSRIATLRGYDRLSQAQSDELRNYEHHMSVREAQRREERREQLRRSVRLDDPAWMARNTESGADNGPAPRDWAPKDRQQQMRDNARRALDGIEHLSDAAREQLTRSVERAEAIPDGIEASAMHRWLHTAGSPAYERAVAKLLADPQDGHREFTAEELRAYQAAKVVQRALAIGSDPAGGFLLPVSLDPSVILTSDGTVSAVRQVARVVQIATDKWHGISSDGVTTRWAAEGTEANDDSPDFDGPEIPVHKADSFVPASIEAVMDIPSLQADLRTMFGAARDDQEAAAFVSGSGNGQPKGVVTALAGTASDVSTAGAAAYTRGDVIALQEAVPARFRAGASFLMSLPVLNMTREFPALAGGTDVSMVDDATSPPRLRGWAVREASELGSAVATGNHVAVAGDFKAGYVIVDRIGTTVELVPHLFGPSGRPTGQRGFYAYWRVGADVVAANALRLLTVA